MAQRFRPAQAAATVKRFSKNLRFGNGGWGHSHYSQVAMQLSYPQDNHGVL